MTTTEAKLSSFERLSEGVFVAVAEPASVNIGLVVGTDGALLIDTGSSPEQGAAIREAAERLTNVPIIAVVVTHWHYDHFFGLAGLPGIRSVGHETLPGWLNRPELADVAAELGVDPQHLVAPSETFSLVKAIDLGQRRVEVIHFGPAHTDGDLVVFVPDSDVIFAGDLVESAGEVQIGSDSAVESWPSAIDGILSLTREHSIIIPGHGPAMDRFSAFEQRNQLAAPPNTDSAPDTDPAN